MIEASGTKRPVYQAKPVLLGVEPANPSHTEHPCELCGLCVVCVIFDGGHECL